MFQRSNRLTSEADIKRVLRLGKKISTKEYSLYFLSGGLATRVAVVVGTAVSKNATLRNRLKRQVRDVLRRAAPERIRLGDLVIIVRAAALQIPDKLRGKHFTELCQRVGLSK